VIHSCLHYVAVRCRVLQCVAQCYRVFLGVVTCLFIHINIRVYTYICAYMRMWVCIISSAQRTGLSNPTHCNTLQHTATHCNTMQHMRLIYPTPITFDQNNHATNSPTCSFSMCCIVLQCVAVCCSVLQCVAVSYYEPFDAQLSY